MKRPPRRAISWTLFTVAILSCGAAVLVVSIPSWKLAAKKHWREMQRPAVPDERSRLGPGTGSPMMDPPFFGNAVAPTRPTLHFMPGNTMLNERVSPALVRRVGDVSDSLVSISAGFMMKCSARSPEVRITIRIDHLDGACLEWNEKRLRPDEHRPGEWERFNFEWLLRGLPVNADDLVSIFIRNPDDAEIELRDLDVVFRSGRPLKPRP